jgi:hypothetical protein
MLDMLEVSLMKRSVLPWVALVVPKAELPRWDGLPLFRESGFFRLIIEDTSAITVLPFAKTQDDDFQAVIISERVECVSCISRAASDLGYDIKILKTAPGEGNHPTNEEMAALRAYLGELKQKLA